jgi:hypothetical protein
VVRIIGTDEQEEKVMVHAGGLMQAPSLPEGVKRLTDLSIGQYDVAVSAGPSLETKRAEAFEALNAFVQAYPAAFPLLGDLLVGSLDWPGAKAAAERLKRAVPPQVLSGEGDEATTIPPEIAAQMQALMQQLEAQGLALQEAQQLIQTKKLELDAKAQAEREKGVAALALAQFKAEAEARAKAMEIQLQAQADAFLAKLEAQLEQVTRRIEHAHDRAMAAQGRVDDREDADRVR